jgi:anti-anti-sigma factor
MLMRKVRAAGGRLVLCKVRPTIEDLLRVTQLADVLPHYADEQEAVCSF